MLDRKTSGEYERHHINASREYPLAVVIALLRFAILHARVSRQSLNSIARVLSLRRFQRKRYVLQDPYQFLRLAPQLYLLRCTQCKRQPLKHADNLPRSTF